MSAPGNVHIEFRAFGEQVALDAPAPPVSARLDHVLPLLRLIEDAIVDRAIAQTEADGATLSCRKGCSACCRAQAVPVTPPEAYDLLRLVEDLPPSRQAEIRRRFREALSRIREAGLEDRMLQRDPPPGIRELEAIGKDYQQLGIACPFLEDDACSIYERRPFVCRQYLVTSPASFCLHPTAETIEPVLVPTTPGRATLKMAAMATGEPQYAMLLIMALEYAQVHRERLEQEYPADDLIRGWLSGL